MALRPIFVEILQRGLKSRTDRHCHHQSHGDSTAKNRSCSLIDRLQRFVSQAGYMNLALMEFTEDSIYLRSQDCAA